MEMFTQKKKATSEAGCSRGNYQPKQQNIDKLKVYLSKLEKENGTRKP